MIAKQWLVLLAVNIPFVLFAAESDLERRIADLNQRLEQTLRKELEAELKAQPYIFENWNVYIQHVREAEEKEAEAREIRNEIQKLMERKRNS